MKHTLKTGPALRITTLVLLTCFTSGCRQGSNGITGSSRSVEPSLSPTGAGCPELACNGGVNGPVIALSAPTTYVASFGEPFTVKWNVRNCYNGAVTYNVSLHLDGALIIVAPPSDEIYLAPFSESCQTMQLMVLDPEDIEGFGPTGAGSVYSFTVSIQSNGPSLSASANGLAELDASGPTTPVITSLKRSGCDVLIAWATSTDSGSGLDKYQLFRNGTLLTSTTATSFVDVHPCTGQADYRVIALDNLHNPSSPGLGSIDLSQAPMNPPGNLQHTAWPVSLSWSPVTGCGTTTYKVFLNGTLLGTTTGTSWSAGSAVPCTHYTFGVAAVDCQQATSGLATTGFYSGGPCGGGGRGTPTMP